MEHTEQHAREVSNAEPWEKLPISEWQETKDTLHLWTQIVGKIRLKQTPLINHFWNSALYISARGLTTSAMPCERGVFEIEFDFIDHNLTIKTSTGKVEVIKLEPKSVSQFYGEVMTSLRKLSIDSSIRDMPDEIPNAISFSRDEIHKSYDRAYAARFWQILTRVSKVFNEFRSNFIGKASPVHFWWGSFDLAATRFNGARAPERPGADSITREAYSHANISHGFWPGGDGMEAAFYAYAAPEPDGFKNARVAPSDAFYSTEMSEFFLMYDTVRETADPEATLTRFLSSTYEAAADLSGWNRGELER